MTFQSKIDINNILLNQLELFSIFGVDFFSGFLIIIIIISITLLIIIDYNTVKIYNPLNILFNLLLFLIVIALFTFNLVIFYLILKS